jgi:hypothetical protein
MSEEAIEPSVEQEESTGLLDGATAEVEEANPDENPQKVEIDHRDPEELKAKEEFGLDESEDDDEPLERPDWFPKNFWKEEESEPDLERKYHKVNIKHQKMVIMIYLHLVTHQMMIQLDNMLLVGQKNMVSVKLH